MIKEINKEKLKIKIFNTRSEMGKSAANEFCLYLQALLLRQGTANIIFAAAPSQLDFLSALKEHKEIDWEKVNVFHMDEYVGVSIEQEQSFAKFIKTHIADNFPVKNFFALNGMAENIDEEINRYSALLSAFPVDIVCLGIGENCHIAFNDPGEADFWDKHAVKVVKLDQKCREQQVHDKCFPCIDDVPKTALTLTVPALLRAKAMFCLVPSDTKADAVAQTVQMDIDVMRPSSALRLHGNAIMYCDLDSGKGLLS